MKYIKELRSIMERQRSDPAFTKLVPTIDAQIQGLYAKEKELQAKEKELQNYSAK
jgi:hypothetical protein